MTDLDQKGSRGPSVRTLKKGESINSLDGDRQNFLHYLCRTNDPVQLENLLSGSASRDEIKKAASALDTKGRSPAMLAALSGSQKCLQMLADVSDLDAIDYNGDALIHLAAMSGNTVLVEEVLNPGNINKLGNHGWTPLMSAAANGKSEVFDYLVSKNADQSLIDADGDTLIHLACKGGNKAIVEKLVTPENINSRGKLCRTPIMAAAVAGKGDIFDFLVSQSADISLTDDNGEQLIHLACRGGSKHIVESVLTEDNTNERGQHGRPPIMIAAMNGHLDIVEFLLSKEAFHLLTDYEGESTIHLACRSKNKNIVEKVFKTAIKDDFGKKALTPIMIAALLADKETFDYLVSEKADVKVRDRNDFELVHVACLGGNLEIVKKFLTPESVNYTGRFKNIPTPVMLASSRGNKEVFDFLVASKANLNVIDESGMGLIHHACNGGNKDIIERVLTPENINLKDNSGNTPIMFAAQAGNLDAFDLLMAKKAELCHTLPNGNSLLHQAVTNGNMDIVKHLVTQSNINSRGLDNWTPIMIAAVNGNIPLFEFLASLNADLSLVAANGEELIHKATQSGNRILVERLLTPENINHMGNFTWTPIMLAAARSHPHLFELFLSRGADTTLVDDKGDSLIHLACSGGRKSIVERVLTPSNMECKGMNDWTPIMRAAVHGSRDIFNLLVSKGADQTLKDSEGDTLLHLACQGGNADIVYDLLNEENLESRGRNTWTPLIKAACLGHRAVVELLYENGADLEEESDDMNDAVDIAMSQGHLHLAKYMHAIFNGGLGGWSEF